jgi:FMN hydrolase / 5-amino-6-(5-phospho-D-ribitylamino)uracil phosphatase
VLDGVRAIAFDLDNTLWDVEPVIERAELLLGDWLRQHCPRIAQHLSRADMRRAREELAQREPHNAHDFSYLRLTALKRHAREHGYHEERAHTAFEVFLSARNQVAVFADVVPGLTRLATRFRLASLSNGNADLARIGLQGLFTLSLNARQIGAAKPARRCFEELARGLELPGSAIAYVGDDPQLDVVAARAAGLHSVWLERRARVWPAALTAPDLVASDCSALADALGC